jgi:hypothetical protein
MALSGFVFDFEDLNGLNDLGLEDFADAFDGTLISSGTTTSFCSAEPGLFGLDFPDTTIGGVDVPGVIFGILDILASNLGGVDVPDFAAAGVDNPDTIL